MHPLHRPAIAAAARLLRENQRISALGRAGDVAAARRVFDAMPKRDVVSWNALLTALWQGGRDLPAALRLFDAMPSRNVISWNSIVAGCLAHGDLDAASAYFARAPRRNVATWNAMLAGLVRLGRMEDAERLFGEMPVRNVVSFTTMVDGLARCGEVARAREVFDAMPERSLVSWAAMISGYVENAMFIEAKELFQAMPEKNVVACTAMITGYCKEGDVESARRLFDRIAVKDVISWNAMLAGKQRNHREGNSPKQIWTTRLGYLVAIRQHMHPQTADCSRFNRLRNMATDECYIMEDLAQESGFLISTSEYTSSSATDLSDITPLLISRGDASTDVLVDSELNIASTISFSSLILLCAAASLTLRDSYSCIIFCKVLSFSDMWSLSREFSTLAISSDSLATLASPTACFSISLSREFSSLMTFCDSINLSFSSFPRVNSPSNILMQSMSPLSFSFEAAISSSDSTFSLPASSRANLSFSSVIASDPFKFSTSVLALSSSACTNESLVFASLASVVCSFKAMAKSSMALLHFSSDSTANLSSRCSDHVSTSPGFAKEKDIMPLLLKFFTGSLLGSEDRVVKASKLFLLSWSEVISSFASSKDTLVSSSCFVWASNDHSSFLSESRAASSSPSNCCNLSARSN
ncbi:hypothetical protein EJB05_48628, partial [Eragrostis curvula]